MTNTSDIDSVVFFLSESDLFPFVFNVRASTADLTYETTASGSVVILTPYDRSVSTHADALRAANAAWGAENDISVSWKSFAEGTDYRNDYIAQVLDACKNKEMGVFDVVWLESSEVGLLADCMEDLWSWSETIAVEHGGVVARGAVVNERLVGLPAELAFGIMLYNSDLLEKYGYYYYPSDIDELEEMAITVLTGERALENYKLSGWTGPLTETEDLISWATEWFAGIKQTILSDTGSVTIGTTAVASFLARLTVWLAEDIIDDLDVDTTDMAAATTRFRNKQSIFLRTTTAHVPEIIASPPSFDWGIAPVPSQLENGLGIGTAEGWFVGVFKYSSNKPGAVRVAEYLTSEAYQKAKILDLGASMVGTYPNFFLDKSICEAYGTVADVSLCSTYAQVSLTRRPIPQAGVHYANLSSQVQETLMEVMTGETYIITALTALDASLRVLFGQPAVADLGLEIDESTVIRPSKKTPENVETQLAGLLAVAAVTAVIVALLRRQQRRKMEQKLIAGNPSSPTRAAQEMQQADNREENGAAGKGKSRAGDERGDSDENAALIEKSDTIEI
ncbi:hypothetical protein HKX48_006462 [Thoreauomyces humboldtii]|nr:hypothetical protein HKX48_006462 [Thoreauomyces humboldtii]